MLLARLPLAALALAPLASAQFTNAVVPDFRGWERTYYVGWDTWSGLEPNGFVANPDDAATTAPSSWAFPRFVAQNGFSIPSPGIICTDGVPITGFAYVPPVGAAIDEVVVQVKTTGGAPGLVNLEYWGFTGGPNPDADYLGPVEFRDLGNDEYYYRFAASMRGLNLGTFGEMRSFSALVDTSGTAMPGCIDAVRIDVRHTLENHFTPSCSSEVLNSLNVRAATDVGGSSLAADNLIELTATGIPSPSWGYFVMSETLNPNPCTANCPGTQGVSCIGGNPARLGPALLAGDDLVFERTIDLTNIPTFPMPSTVVAGSTWYFQAWYRDANPNVTSNFTRTAGIVFQ